jgi:intein/homing endonuclease
MKPIEPSSHTTEKAEIYVERLKEGDHIVIYPTSGEPIRMEVVAVTDADIRGNTSTDLEITIRTEDIARIERKEFAAGDTAAAAVGWSIGSVLLFFTIIGPLLFVLTY